MTENQTEIIDRISLEISKALISCEHSRHEEGGNIDEIDAYMEGYKKKAVCLRRIRNELEIEFTSMLYDPR